MTSSSSIRVPEGCRLVKSFRVTSPDDTDECHISAIGESEEANIVMADWMNRSIKLFDNDLNCIQSIDVPSGPRDLCVSEGTVYVVCDYDRKVHVFTLSSLVVVGRKSPDVSEGSSLSLVRQAPLEINECMYCQGVCWFGTQLCLSVRMKDMSAQIRLLDRAGNQLKYIDTGVYYGRLSPILGSQSVAMAPLEVGVLIFINIENGEYSKRQLGDRRRVGVTAAGEGSVFAIDDRGDVSMVLPDGHRQIKLPNERGRDPGRGICYRDTDDSLILQRYARTDTVEIYQLVYPQSDGTTLPEEILKLDRRSVELYRSALASGYILDHDIRLMLVGHYGVGKTALRKRLLGDAVDVNKREATDGIAVHTRTAQVGLDDGRWRQIGNTSSSMFGRLAKVLEKPRSGQSEAAASEGDTKEKFIGATTADVEGDEGDGGDMPDLELSDEILGESNTVDSSPTVAGQRGESKSTSLPTPSTDEGGDDASVQDKDTEREEGDILEELKGVISAAADPSASETSALVSIWDFAGQSVFYSTHQVFLSKRAVYLLVTDMSKHVDDIVQDDDGYFDSFGAKSRKVSEFVEFWLNSIHCYCGSTNPNVILVATHADKLDQSIKTELVERYFLCVRNLFMEKDSKAEHVVEDEFSIDNSVPGDPELERLKKTILEVASKQPYWGNRVPARWITLEKTFTGLREKGMKIMPRAELPLLNQALPVPLESEEEMDLFLTFQHELGTILYFSEPSLREYVLLDPQWVVDAIKCLITAEHFCTRKPHIAKLWKEFNTQALLKNDLLKAVWDSDDNTKFWEHHKHILRLMERLDLIARPRLEEDDLYFVPCVLKEKHDPELLKPSKFHTTSHLCFTTSCQFIPTAIFNRLLAACMTKWPLYKQKGKPCIFCGCGIFQVSDTHRLTVYFSQDFVQIWVTCMATSARPEHSVCSAVRGYIEDTLKRIFADTENAGEIHRFIKCPRAEIESMSEIIEVEKFQTSTSDEVPCANHEETHMLRSATMLHGWFKVKEDAGPATSQEPASKMSEYYCKMGTLVLDICPQPLRELFIQEAKKNTPTYTTLDAYLLTRQQIILARGVLKFTQQRDTLYPANGDTDISKWDITLLTSLLLKLFASLPQVLRDFITTIREERNTFQHMGDTQKMTSQEFTQKWNTLETAVNGITGYLSDPSLKDELAEKMKTLANEPFHTDSDSIMKRMQQFEEMVTNEFKALRTISEEAAAAHKPLVTPTSALPLVVQQQIIAAAAQPVAVPLQTGAATLPTVVAPSQTMTALAQNVTTASPPVTVPLQTMAKPSQTVATPSQSVAVPAQTVPVPSQIMVTSQTGVAASQTLATTTQTMAASLQSVAATAQTAAAPSQNGTVLQQTMADSKQNEAATEHAIPVVSNTQTIAPNTLPVIERNLEQNGVSRSQTIPSPQHTISTSDQIMSVPEQIMSVPEHTMSVPEQTMSVPEQIMSVTEQAMPVTEQTLQIRKQTLSSTDNCLSASEHITLSHSHTLTGQLEDMPTAEQSPLLTKQTVTTPTETSTSTTQEVLDNTIPNPGHDKVSEDQTVKDPPKLQSVQNRIMSDAVQTLETSAQNVLTQEHITENKEQPVASSDTVAVLEQSVSAQEDHVTYSEHTDQIVADPCQSYMVTDPDVAAREQTADTVVVPRQSFSAVPQAKVVPEQHDTCEARATLGQQNEAGPLIGYGYGWMMQQVSVITVLFAIVGVFAVGYISGGRAEQFDGLMGLLILVSIGYFAILYLRHNT